MVECYTCNVDVGGSSPSTGSNDYYFLEDVQDLFAYLLFLSYICP